MTRISALALASMAGLAAAQLGAPAVTVPAGTDIAGNPFTAPGAFPSRATGGNWFLATPRNAPDNFTRAVAAGLIPSGVGGNFYSLFEPSTPVAGDAIFLIDLATGPIPMTTGTLNNGDNDFNIGASSGPAPSFPLTSPAAVDAITPLDIEDEVLDPANNQLGDGFWDAFRSTGNQGSAINCDVENLSLPNGQPTYAWAADSAFGVMLASVMNIDRDNVLIGVDFSQFPNFALLQLPPTRGHVSASPGRGSGVGYNMATGEFFGAGGTGSRPSGAIFLTTNMFEPDLSFEFTCDYSAFWFPYAAGWTGAWVTTPGDAGGAPAFLRTNDGDGNLLTNAKPGLDEAVVAWTNFAQARGRIDLTADPDEGGTPDDGMLFMISADNPSVGANPDLGGLLGGDILVGSYPNIIGVLPAGDGWDFAIRQSDQLNTDGIAPPPDLDESPTSQAIQNEFAFLYLPYDTCGLNGATIAPDASILASADSAAFVIEKIGPGRYAIGIDGDGPRNLTDRDGGLMLQVTGALAGGGLDNNPATPEPDRAYAIYDFDPDYQFADGSTGAFIVATFELVNTGYNDRDAGFAFAWFDFTSPFTPPFSPDLTGDGTLDIFDILDFFVRFGANDPSADANSDGALNIFDILAFFEVFGAGAPGCPNA